jgi:hypothetical protein
MIKMKQEKIAREKKCKISRIWDCKEGKNNDRRNNERRE